jgi:hypothetical protein
MRIVSHIQEHGLGYTVNKAILLAKRRAGILEREFKDIPRYKNPTAKELEAIESEMRLAGLNVEPYAPSPEAFSAFLAKSYFPASYHGGADGGVYVEKVLEHWISHQLLGIGEFGPEDVFVDVAAAASPWAKILRENLSVKAFANDLGHIGRDFKHLECLCSQQRSRHGLTLRFRNVCW